MRAAVFVLVVPLVLVGLVVGLGLAGCARETDRPEFYEDGRPTPDPLTAYDDPGDFEREGCVPGALAGFDPEGEWRLGLSLGENYTSDGYLRVDLEGQGYLSLLSGGGMGPFIDYNADHLFAWLRLDAFGPIAVSLLACRRREDGRLLGRYADCTSEGCRVGDVVAGPLGPLADEDEGSGLELVSEIQPDPESVGWGGTRNVRVRDGVAYLVGSIGLAAIDVSAPATPRLLGVFDGYGNDVKIVDGADGRRYALLAETPGVTSVDVTDPTQMIARSEFPPPISSRGGVHTLFTEARSGRTRAYLADAAIGGLSIFDVTDPPVPVPLGSYVLPEAREFGGYVHDLFVEDGRAYLSYWSRGLAIVETEPDPRDPSLVGRFFDNGNRTAHSVWVTTAGGCQVAVSGDEGYGAHVRLIGVDRECPSSYLELLGEFETRPEVSVHNIMAVGERAYVAYYHDGVRVLDLADPRHPRQIGYYNSFRWEGGAGPDLYQGAIGIDVDPTNRLVYVADTRRGLVILRETLPSRRPEASGLGNRGWELRSRAPHN